MATTVWKGYLTFGLVSIPVRLFRAARAERISFHQVHRTSPQAETYERVHSVPTLQPPPSAETEPEASAPGVPAPAPQRVPSDEIAKGYEYEKDHYVVVDPQELKQLAPKTSGEMQIAEFVRLDEIDPVFFETSYYLSPDEAGEKAYALLFEAMKETGFVAISQVAMHRREHVMVVRPGQHGLITHTMFYVDEIRADQEYRADPAEVNPKELQLAKQLVTSLASPFEPGKFKDAYRARVQDLIDARLAGKQVAVAAPAPKQAPVVDILEALQKSLKAVKKPAASEKPHRETRARASRR